MTQSGKHGIFRGTFRGIFSKVLKLILNGSKWSKHTPQWVWGISEMWLSSHDASWKKTEFLTEFCTISSKVPLTLFTLDMMFQKAVALFCVNLRDVKATFQLRWHYLENTKNIQWNFVFSLKTDSKLFKWYKYTLL